MMTEQQRVDMLVEMYQDLTRRFLRGGLFDAQVDALCDEQEKIVRQLRTMRTVRELARSPWIEVS